MTTILIHPPTNKHHRNDCFEDFLDFNNVTYTHIDLRIVNEHHGGSNDSVIDLDRFQYNDSAILVLDSRDFFLTIQDSSNIQKIINICKIHKIIVITDLDSIIYTNDCMKLIANFDLEFRKNSLLFFSDGMLNVMPKLQNICIFETMQSAFISQIIRIPNVEYTKQNCKNDFLLTMGKDRHHRILLWDELDSRNLLQHGECIFHRKRQMQWITNSDERIGNGNQYLKPNRYHIPHIVRFVSSFLSMDLYLNSWFEVVPETLYEDAFFITEKTVRSISSRTPILVLSTPGFLKKLRSMGFQTFGNLINESYDTEPVLEKRISMLADQIQSIIDSGSESFYHASKSILDHNYEVLASISGKWQHNRDQIFHNMINVQ